ncbi:MAG: peptide chain release factor N(5)-glutamine methyltransferase [Pyrinomonadaceae bacterium]
MNVSIALRAATDALNEAGLTDGRRESASLLCFALDRPNAFLIAHPEYELTTDEAARLEEYIKRRAAREPFQHITGRQEFWGLDFEVSSAVLIPRPETEILVEAAIATLQTSVHQRFCEIGVGSGCISVSILHSVANAKAVGVDISPAALAIARCNAAKHRVDERLDLIQGSLFADIDTTFDLIVSNPPYIPDADIKVLQPEVRDFEPHTALAGGPSGLDIVEEIIECAPKYLQTDGVMLVEIGSGQAAAVRKMLAPDIWDETRFLLDLQGIERILHTRLKSHGRTK